MKLDSFEVAYTAANKLFLKGESLVCEGEGITVAVRHVISDQQQIEVLYLKGGAHNHQIERFNASNYQSSGLAQLDVATSFLPLLT
jgi:hypothetical protein